MTFDDMVAEVSSITKRPDLLDRIKSAVRAATLKAHHTNYYSRDLVEVSLQFEFPEYVQNFYPKSVLPAYRAPKYIRRWDGDVNNFIGGLVYKPITIDNFLDGYGYEKTDVWYISGDLIQIKSSCQIQYFVLGAYKHPSILFNDFFESWISAEYPWAVIYEACRSIFNSIGFQEQASQYTNLVAEEYKQLYLSASSDMQPT